MQFLSNRLSNKWGFDPVGHFTGLWLLDSGMASLNLDSESLGIYRMGPLRLEGYHSVLAVAFVYILLYYL